MLELLYSVITVLQTSGAISSVLHCRNVRLVGKMETNGHEQGLRVSSCLVGEIEKHGHRQRVGVISDLIDEIETQIMVHFASSR